MSYVRWAFGIGALVLALAITGCTKTESASEKQLSATQAQLDEANKKLEAAGIKPVPATPAAGATPGSGDSQQPPAGPVTHTLTAGTSIAVRTAGPISTKTSASGTTFEATLHQPLEVDGYLVAPRGATVEGVVLNSDPGGRVKGVASLTVALRRVVLADGRTLAISTNSRGAVAHQTKRKDAMKVGIASGIGAAIGAIAGGGKGAAIGAGAGAGGGTGVVLATKGDPAVIPAESIMTFKLAAPVNAQELKK